MPDITARLSGMPLDALARAKIDTIAIDLADAVHGGSRGHPVTADEIVGTEHG